MTWAKMFTCFFVVPECMEPMLGNVDNASQVFCLELEFYISYCQWCYSASGRKSVPNRQVDDGWSAMATLNRSSQKKKKKGQQCYLFCSLFDSNDTFLVIYLLQYAIPVITPVAFIVKQILDQLADWCKFWEQEIN